MNKIQTIPRTLTDEQIDRIAENCAKGMEGGIRGFCNTWGWRQFARELLDVCAGHVRAPAEPTDAMVDAYLLMQRQVVEDADHFFGRPNCGALHTNTVREACRAGLRAAIAGAPAAPADPAIPYTYASTQATNCAGCGEYKHTPLRVDRMDGYVCLTCIDKRLDSLLDNEAEARAEPANPAREATR